ncbi:putative T7SS-secreted protein [Streptomyces lonegramiae]|uniref:RHS repeat-associated core domain-containing protein n=1 Tax=Streptomyces lonegramiae TaxID=3075524 RepID=A0ABU2XVF0_9ACTN|nr:RHS repeat-associated core domain-containing protein [Streptomyces sp. DSM 41529]MDT0549905.1 RHS repeat-associated core domain-containing protein [Streptomyces sp. DSM 41529]
MGLGDFIPVVVEDWVEDRVEDVGGAIDDAGDWTADRLDDVGWQSGADWVRDKSDSAANALGAAVDEMQLGESGDAKKLIHGSPSKLRSTASHLSDFKTAFNNVGKGLRGLGSQSLKGKAADAFRESVSVEPKKWFAAADACEKASGALDRFAGTVEWAQGQAEEAIRRYKKGKKASDDARSAHNGKVSAYNKAVDAYNGLPADKRDPSSLPDKPGAFHDPGAADIKAAQDILQEARRQRDEAHGVAKTAVEGARDAAPKKPSYAQQLGDGLQGLNLDASHFLGGVVKGTAGLLNFARQVNPLEPYNITHPAEYATNLNNTAAGLLRMANDPGAAIKGMWDAFQQDPSEGLGRLVPELIGTKGLGGAKAAVTAAERLPATMARAERSGLQTLAKDGPAPHATPDAARTAGGTDPVDLASGRMYLPQRDVVLPGALPLVFVRRVESGYRAGRWFGPSWSSTADQRLEIGARGVAFVSEDGLLLSYPHPAPGVPTLPELGPRWPLERTAEGDYTLTDPDTGHTRYFTGPEGGGDGEAPLAEINDRNGHRLTFEYDTDGAPTGIVHSGGYHLKITTEDGRITALHLMGADQQLIRYAYTDGNLTEAVKSSGLPLRFEYDTERRVIAWIDTNDRRYDYVYDNRDRCIAEGGTEGHIALHIDYGPVDERTGHRVTTVTTADGGATRYLVNDRCQVIAVTDPLGHTTRTRRDRHGRILSRTDALGRTTGYTYDAAGRPSSVTTPDGHRRTAAYNALNLPVEVTHADGATWRYAYDERGNRTTATDPLGHTTRYTYDDHGHLATVTNALGDTTRVRYDPAGLPVEITDPLGAATTYRRDAFGRPTSITDPLGATIHMEWTIEGKLARRTAPDGTEQTWAYDGEGNVTAHVDAGGGVTTYEYTHFDLLAAQTGPDGVRHEFTHDSQLRLTQVTNPQGLTWTYTYNPTGLLLSETDFDSRTLTYTYDAAGQLISRTNSLGQTVRLAYDDSGRTVRKDAEGQVTTFTYDPAGRLVEAVGPEVALTYRRDRMGRAIAEVVGDRVLTRTYDALGRPVRRTTPSGAKSTFSYDAAGHRTALTTCGHTLDFTYDALGRETTRQLGPTATLAQIWDPAGRLAEQTLTGPEDATLQHRAYTYRPDGHLTATDDQLLGPRAFDLDDAGRVTTVRAEGWTETYAYDEAGNQTHATWPTDHPATTGARAYTGTRITRAGRVRYEHDTAGRLTLRQKTRLTAKPDTWHYTWDTENHLTTLTTPDGTHWRYLYDPLGRRTTKQRLADDGQTVLEQTDFTWDGTTLVEQTTTTPDLPNPTTLTWEHDGFRPLTQTQRTTDPTTQREIDRRFYAIVTDLVGTPTELIDETGDIAWQARTTLWGTTTEERTGQAHTPLRFPGQYFDPESGLHYNHHRYYDPTTARYLTPDPLGLTPAPNPVAYVPNPHLFIDPLGLSPYDDYEGIDFYADDVGQSASFWYVNGRPDGEMVFFGHGSIRAGDTSMVTVPEGTSVGIYHLHGELIYSDEMHMIANSNTTPLNVIESGQQMPDYSLYPPTGLGTPAGKSVVSGRTVTQETRLSQLLLPNMGRVHWVACRAII